VSWRAPVDEDALRRRELVAAAYTFAYVVPLVGFAALLVALEPLTAPVAIVSLALAWVVPELFTYRGARVLLPAAAGREEPPERRAQGFLGDLLDHSQRELQRRTGLVLERGSLGAWLVGESGALLVRPGGRRVHTFCARATDDALPPSDRIAHLVLALREDEVGFSTVANHAFAGAFWRMWRRVRSDHRPGLAAARAAARRPGPSKKRSLVDKRSS
jgi:hypothetical protein